MPSIGFLHVHSFQKPIKKFEALVLTKKKPRQVNQKNSKVYIGLYALHLQKWLRYFPLKQMHFVNGDDYIKNPVAELDKVQKFLKVCVFLFFDKFLYVVRQLAYSICLIGLFSNLLCFKIWLLIWTNYHIDFNF